MNLHVIVYFLAGTALQSAFVSSHFTAFPHEHPHQDNFYHNPNPYQYQPQPAPHPEQPHPHVAPHPAPVNPHHEPAYHVEPAPVHPHEPVHPHPSAYHAEPEPTYAHHQPYGYQPTPHPAHYQEPYQYQHPDMYGRYPDPSYQPYNPYTPHHAAHPVHPQPAHAAHKPVVVTTPAPAPAGPETTAVAPAPKYLGTFKNPSHDVKGDIFMLDQNTLYIQGFSFDGQAPDPYFWSDGIPIPYYTRSDPNVTMKLKKYTNEDVVLMLPPGKPTLDALGHFQVWCAMFNVVFGEFDMKDAHKP